MLQILRSVLSFLNRLMPKFERVVIEPFPNSDSNSVELANYIARNYKLKIYFAISSGNCDSPKTLLHPSIIVIKSKSLAHIWLSLTSKFIFFTHGTFMRKSSSKQTVVNLWHGVGHKKICTYLGLPGVPADITVATSDLTKHIFSRAFGVPEETVVISGYPRNDILIRAKSEKNRIRTKIDPKLNSFSKVVIWLPTFRQYKNESSNQHGKEVGNPFYIENFDVNYFNQLLKAENALCIIKPHPMAPQYDTTYGCDHLLFIDDEWVSKRGVTLYHLLGCTDMLISDVSSVIVDYLLIDQPVICVSADLEEYKQTRGFYFEHIEDWLPSRVIRTEVELFNYLQNILQTGRDSYEDKRRSLKAKFFKHFDGNSSKRLVEKIIIGESYQR